MTPQLVHLKEEDARKLRKARTSVEFFEHNLESLRTNIPRYIVLHGSDIIADASSADEAWATARKGTAPIGECVLVYIPPEGESCFY